MKIVITGDLMAGARQPVLSKELDQFFESGDFRICNLEGPITTTEQQFVKRGPYVKQGVGIAPFLSHFTHATLANNHIMDYSQQGLMDSLEFLQDLKVEAMGAGHGFEQVYRPVSLEKDGLKVAVLNWAESQFGCLESEEQSTGYAWIGNHRNNEHIRELKETNDHVIIISHCGLEMEDLPLPEWRRIFRSFIDAGADLVVNHHPHVVQGMEIYQGKRIYYSLGNFFFAKTHSDQRWNHSLVLSCSINKSNMTFDHCFTKQANNEILRDNTYSSRFNDLGGLLANENWNIYLQEVNRVAQKVWESYYRDYYAFKIFKPEYKDSPKWIKWIMNRLHNRYIHYGDEMMLLHNIKIETHRFVVQRALSQKHQTY